MNDNSNKQDIGVDLAFRMGEVSKATPEQLEQWLNALCNGVVPNETVRHREIIRGLTINHVQMARTIRELEDTMRHLNASNDKTQQLVVRLTWVAVAVGLIQAVAAVISLWR